MLYGCYLKLLKEYENILPWINQKTIKYQVKVFEKKYESVPTDYTINTSVPTENPVTESITTENHVTESVPTDYPITASVPTANNFTASTPSENPVT